jgi:hypothetical protein
MLRLYAQRAGSLLGCRGTTTPSSTLQYNLTWAYADAAALHNSVQRAKL